MKEKQTFRVLCILLLTLMTSAVGDKVMAADYPGQIMLDNMVDLYGGVVFDHEMHADLGEDCAVCHHHTTGTGTTDQRCVRCHADSPEAASVACKDCHVVDSFSAQQINQKALDLYQYHVDKPGLKAAYHWSCMGCHKEMDGPTGCVDCHVRTDEGVAFYHEDARPSSDGHKTH